MAENQQPAPRVNPLLSALRQPKIYITLPSGGKFWPEGSLNPSVNGEYPVYSMTAKDELLVKTPDALLNGQAIVSMIQSCMPNVLNAWDTPQLDLDAILVAIRLATYGEMITLKINHPSMDGESEYEVNIREILDRIQNNTTWEDRLEIRPDLVVFLKPLNYRDQTDAQVTDFEANRIFQIANSKDLPEEERIRQFSEAFGRLTKKTITILGRAVYRVESTGGAVEDAEMIEEFIENCDAEIFDKIKSRLGIMSEANQLKPLTINSTPEMIERGAPPTLDVPFSFDESNFFG